MLTYQRLFVSRTMRRTVWKASSKHLDSEHCAESARERERGKEADRVVLKMFEVHCIFLSAISDVISSGCHTNGFKTNPWPAARHWLGAALQQRSDHCIPIVSPLVVIGIPDMPMNFLVSNNISQDSVIDSANTPFFVASETHPVASCVPYHQGRCLDLFTEIMEHTGTYPQNMLSCILSLLSISPLFDPCYDDIWFLAGGVASWNLRCTGRADTGRCGWMRMRLGKVFDGNWLGWYSASDGFHSRLMLEPKFKMSDGLIPKAQNPLPEDARSGFFTGLEHLVISSFWLRPPEVSP